MKSIPWIFGVVWSVFLTTTSFGTVILVPVDQPTIQQGIDAAVNGDTVLIADGTYTGALNKNLDFGGKIITVESDTDLSTCVIDCEGDGRGFFFHMSETSAAVLRGITIQNGDVSDNKFEDNRGGGIRCSISSPTIDQCVLINNTAMSGGAISCYQASPIIMGCSLSNNLGLMNGGGMYCEADCSPSITQTLITDNVANEFSGGMVIHENSEVQISETIFSGNRSFIVGALLFSAQSSGSVMNCQFLNNSADYVGAVSAGTRHR